MLRDHLYGMHSSRGQKIFCVQSIINVFLKVNEGVCYIGYVVECITAISVKRKKKKKHLQGLKE